ncbi:MAG TPA: hypothetical protein VEQ41_04335 [Solirubrobacterales bacterium]|nr:hypothetical protein [Solirubrobacterales bacterium]
MLLLGVVFALLAALFFFLAIRTTRHPYGGMARDFRLAWRSAVGLGILALVCIAASLALWILDLLMDPFEQITRGFDGPQE